MKAIRCWNDLERYGIVPLTGEACGLMYRILCDVTARGKRLVEKALSVAEVRLAESWNRGTDADPHIGSYVVAFIMWRGPGSPRRFAHGVRPEGHITGSKSVT